MLCQELPGFTEQLQPAQPRSRNTDEALPKPEHPSWPARGAQRRSPRSAVTAHAARASPPVTRRAADGDRTLPAGPTGQPPGQSILRPKEGGEGRRSRSPQPRAEGQTLTGPYAGSGRCWGWERSSEVWTQPQPADHTRTLSGQPNHPVLEKQYPPTLSSGQNTPPAPLKSRLSDPGCELQTPEDGG